MFHVSVPLTPLYISKRLSCCHRVSSHKQSRPFDSTSSQGLWRATRCQHRNEAQFLLRFRERRAAVLLLLPPDNGATRVTRADRTRTYSLCLLVIVFVGVRGRVQESWLTASSFNVCGVYFGLHSHVALDKHDCRYMCVRLWTCAPRNTEAFCRSWGNVPPRHHGFRVKEVMALLLPRDSSKMAADERCEPGLAVSRSIESTKSVCRYLSGCIQREIRW